MANYIKWDAPGVEIIAPGEKELGLRVAKHFTDMQELHFQQTHHCMRATHLKTQGAVVGKLIVKDNLPEHLAQSMFSKPATFDVAMRYSSLPFTIIHDNIPVPRGLGIKVFGVEGEKLFGNDVTQDFTFNNYPTLELRDMPGADRLGDSLVRNFNNMEQFGKEQAARTDVEVATAPSRVPPQAHMVAMPQWSQGAYRYGDYVVKYAVFPLGDEQKKLAPVMLKPDSPINILSDNLKAFHREHKATFSFQVQLLENLAEQSVEDVGLLWDEEKYPFVEIATLEFEQQDSFNNAFRTWWDDSGTACNPWHGLKTLQPLGSAQRSRRAVYAESRKMRLKMNGRKHYTEPHKVTEIPGVNDIFGHSHA